MVRPSSTVVAVVGEDAGPVLEGLGSLANVDVVRSAADAVRSHAVYVLHDDDPLAGVAAAWAGYVDGEEPAGGLEVAVEQALAVLRGGEVALPDYYVVLDPDSLPATRKHWWFGVLASAAPSRVVPGVAAVRDALPRLPVGRWWPDPADDWLHGLARTVPDQVGVPGAGSPAEWG